MRQYKTIQYTTNQANAIRDDTSQCNTGKDKTSQEKSIQYNIKSGKPR